MFESIVAFAIVIAALGAGLMAGVYFAFSAFIMRSLDRLGAERAVDAMNSINEVIQASWFMALFFGSTLLYAVLAGYAVFATDSGERWWLFSAGLIYVAGMFLCTVLFNLPLNNRLADSRERDNLEAEAWKHYLVYWTRWNHLRTACSLTSATISILYLVQQT